MSIALIDGDIVAYRCAASCMPSKTRPEKEDLSVAISRADELCYRILNSCQADEYRIFISGTDNFRNQLYPEYKANRREIIRPEHLDPVRLFLVGEWKASVTAGHEADDAIGIAANEHSVICSIDKDLRQIPGEHYNFVKDVFDTVSPYDAVRNFYTQLLVGDPSDNVAGVAGIGTVKAGRVLGGCTTKEMEVAVRRLYEDERRYVLNYRLLRIVRSEEEMTEIEDSIRQGQGPSLTAACSFPDLALVSDTEE